MEEQMEVAPLIAAEVEEQPVNAPANSTHDARFEDLERRVHALEDALAEMRRLNASAAAAPGRKTAISASHGLAKGEAAGDRGAVLDASLGSLSVEQRIAVKSGLMRAGLL